MTNQDLEERFREAWSEKLHDELDEYFPKDNASNPVHKSKSRRSEAMAYNALAYSFALDFFRQELQAQKEAAVREFAEKLVKKINDVGSMLAWMNTDYDSADNSANDIVQYGWDTATNEIKKKLDKLLAEEYGEGDGTS